MTSWFVDGMDTQLILRLATINIMQILEEYQHAPCFQCKHLVFNPVEFFCDAFPEVIPEEIMRGKNDHKAIIDGQVFDFVFEQNDEDDCG